MEADGWGRKGNTWEYDEKITADNYQELGYDQYLESGTILSTTNGVVDGNYSYSLNSDGSVQDKDGNSVNSSFTTAYGTNINLGNGNKSKGYFESYFKGYFSYKRPSHANAYSPYIPSGIGVSGGGSLGGFSVSVSVAVNERNDIDFFYSFDGTFRLHNIFSKPWGASATFDLYDNNGKTGNIFDNITGNYRTVSASMIFSGAYSYPIDESGERDVRGTTKTSFGFGSPSVGFGGGRTERLFGKKE